MNLRRLLTIPMLAATAALAINASVPASNWDDDDDIYYNPSKDKSSKVKKQDATSGSNSSTGYIPNTVADYPAADTYAPTGTGLAIDVDSYNRHGSFLVADSAATDTNTVEDTYAYTRRIERFYNEDIVNGSQDSELINSYYSTQPTEINVYVVDPYAYSWTCNPWSWGYPYYNWGWNPYWNWGYGYYDPWYSWNMGWGPAWSWYPGYWPGYPGYWPGHGPGYWPGHGPGFVPGPGVHHWASNSTGASRPHNPTGSGSTTVRRPGAFSAGAATTRPGNMGTGTRYNGTYSPANNTGQTNQRPSVGPGNQSNRPSNPGTLNRGRGNQSNTAPSSTRNQTPNRTTTQPSQRSNSGSSWGSGSGSTRSTGGGSHGRSTGGGHGRGRR